MKVISFFSYKGGAGRSTLAYNTIPILAEKHIHPTAKNPMIVIDTDIDSCGMTYLLDTPDNPVTVTDENCVQTLFSDGCDPRVTPTIKEHPFFGKLCPVGHSYGYEDNEAILLVPAKGGKLIFQNSSSNHTDNGKTPLIPRMKRFLDCCERMNISAVFIDSAVGDNLTAVVSNEISNIIVCCMRPTRQFREGTVGYLQRVETNHISGGKHIVLVPNVIPMDEITIDGIRYPDEAVFRISSTFEKISKDSAHTYHLELTKEPTFGIPALDRFMWCEEVLLRVQKNGTLSPEEELVLSRYSQLAAIIDGIEIVNDDDEDE